MAFWEKAYDLLHEIGPGRMMATAYDTAWAARLVELDEPIGADSLEWLRAHQLPDGSWGAREIPYHHDRLICTLAAMIALVREGNARDKTRWQRAQAALVGMTGRLGADPAGETIGFEMIVPTLMAEAESLGIASDGNDAHLAQLRRWRQAKLAALPQGTISRHVTVAFSSEMAGVDGLGLLDLPNLQEGNGSVGHSPSATAYFALYARPGDGTALEYLRRSAVNGGMPNVAPIDVFEQAWTLWNLDLAGVLDAKARGLSQGHVALLTENWQPGRGIGFASGYTPNDSDVTSVVYEVLHRLGKAVDIEAVQSFEEDEYYRCYHLEANPSVSANVHVLSALREAGFGPDHPSVTKVIGFLDRTQAAWPFWFDKWHASPYYPTAHAIIACAGYQEELTAQAVEWILHTQKQDGSWGFYLPTAEETAYCLQSLVIWKRWGHRVPADAIRRGAAWLAERIDGSYPPLWIGKCLYCPELVVRSAVLSALILAEEE